MSDDTSKQDFENFLKKKDLKYETVLIDGKTIFKIVDYVIPHGKHVGKTVQVAFPIPNDYPSAAPYGMHIKSDHGFTENIPNNNPSPLSSDWQFWSRSVNNWNPGRRNAQYYIDHVNRWLELN